MDNAGFSSLTQAAAPVKRRRTVFFTFSAQLRAYANIDATKSYSPDGVVDSVPVAARSMLTAEIAIYVLGSLKRLRTDKQRFSACPHSTCADHADRGEKRTFFAHTLSCPGLKP